MAVFPESMNKLDLNDTSGSLARLENYINYMGERMLELLEEIDPEDVENLKVSQIETKSNEILSTTE